MSGFPGRRRVMISRRRRSQRWLALIPIVVLVGLWASVGHFWQIPAYKLPGPVMVLTEAWKIVRSGELLRNAIGSIGRLFTAAAIGAGIAIPLGFAIAVNRSVAVFFTPLIAFFQSIAGIAWVPLAIIWFGLGTPVVIFVVANAIFFIVLYNTITGVLTIPPVVHHVVRTLGGTRRHALLHVLLPGALVSILGGLRTGLAFGWRALVVAEIIAAANGLGFMIFDAARFFRSATMIVGILAVGTIWLLMDRLILLPIETRTVRRWGLLRDHAE